MQEEPIECYKSAQAYKKKKNKKWLQDGKNHLKWRIKGALLNGIKWN